MNAGPSADAPNMNFLCSLAGLGHQAACILISVPIFTPNASMRSAMSPDRLALALSKLDRAGRETFGPAVLP